MISSNSSFGRYGGLPRYAFWPVDDLRAYFLPEVVAAEREAAAQQTKIDQIIAKNESTMKLLKYGVIGLAIVVGGGVLITAAALQKRQRGSA